jgi:hypothetical protein
MSSLLYCSVCLYHTLLSPFAGHSLHPPSISVSFISLLFCLLTGFTDSPSQFCFFHSDHIPSHFRPFCFNIRYRDSTVGIATDYGLDGPGIESGGGDKIFRTCPDWPLGPPSLLYMGYRVFPRGKVRQGRAADHSPPSSATIMEE